MLHRVECFREVDRCKNRPIAMLGFVKPIRNGLGKEQNLIKNIVDRRVRKPACRGENKIRFQKEE